MISEVELTVDGRLDPLPVLPGFEDVILTEEVWPEGSTAYCGFTFQGSSGEVWCENFEGRTIAEIYPHDSRNYPVIVEANPAPESIEKFMVAAVKVALNTRERDNG